MTDLGLMTRWALYSLFPVITMGGGLSGIALAAGGLVGLAGLLIERRLRSWFQAGVSFLSVLALLVSLPLSRPHGRPDLIGVFLFAASCAAFFRTGASPKPGAFPSGLIAVMAMAPAIEAGIGASWVHIHPDHLLVALFGSHGLLYGAPLLWAGFAGLVGLGRDRPGLTRLALAAILPGTLALLLATDRDDESTRSLIWMPFLLPGLAWFLDKARSVVSRRPGRVLAAGGALIVVWNLLFMEQYRLRLLPSDDTVSFSQVTSNSAALLSRGVGTPSAWPANWIFAKRFRAPLDRWDGVAGRRLFTTPTTAESTIEFGDDPSVFAADSALLLEGFGTRRTCERGWCRDLYGAGRVLLPLDDVGRVEFVVRVRARGEGTLQMTINNAATAIGELSESLRDLTLRFPARLIAPGISVLSLSVPGGGKATLDRLTLERDLSFASAR